MRSLGLALVVALCAALTAGCGGSSGEPTAAPDVPPAETGAAAATERMPAPAIEGTTVDGEPLALTDYRGKAVLVNVWSSW